MKKSFNIFISIEFNFRIVRTLHQCESIHMCNAKVIDFLFWYFVVVVVSDEFLIRSARQLTIDKIANIFFA